MTDTTKSLIPIPPYQAVDIILAGDKLKELTPPIKGFVVTFPNNGLNAVRLACTESTPNKLAELKALSKWPDHIFYRSAWLHSEQVVFGKICKRNFWTPR